MYSWILLTAFAAITKAAVVPVPETVTVEAVTVPAVEKVPVVAAADVNVSELSTQAASVVTTLSSSQLASFAPFTQFARAAYCPSNEIASWNCGEACRANSGFQPTLTGGDGNDVQLFFVGYWPSQNSVVVAHQGTDPTQFLSVLTDASILQRNLDPGLFPGVPSSVFIHGGFADAHAETAPAILAETKRLIATKGATSVTLIGHSLGGAIAELDALFMKLNLPSNIHVKAVTYGTPRVGNAAWPAYFDAQVPDFTRVNNEKDPIPIVPGRGLGFAHPHGEVHIVSPGKAVACSPDDNATDAQCTISTVPNIFLSNILDHLGPYEGINIGTIFCN
ncbi:alpha/beta-hydrolase [Cristinia sonorae]|uniref:Alpha/beta-hydrolase n=1 Tax=Cristinia sonorae TaxID=1940300 RepID=A0A8K0UV97_9AGAR|nr:alpha/beta-hydrolase [Cristinia sonorae]